MRSLLFSNHRAKSVVGKVSFVHGDKNSSSSAFEISEAAKVRILLPRLLGVVSASVRIFSESLHKEVARLDCVWSDAKGDLDLYEGKDLTMAFDNMEAPKAAPTNIDDYVITFGKYKGIKLIDLFKRDRHYCMWLKENSYQREVVEMIKQIEAKQAQEDDEI